jgi:hypothetical protein
MGNEAFCLEEKAMTPSAEKIQRWEVFDGGVNACWVGETTDGPYVLHSDHLAALKRAKAEAREELKRELEEMLLEYVCSHCFKKVERQVAAFGRSFHMVADGEGREHHFPCTAGPIHARLAELEREGA